MPEILAPAGSFEALKAAVANGADAVYLGGKSFNARAFADNFDLQTLREAAAFAHFHGVKLYLTLNILLQESELPQALAYLEDALAAGVDAVILQDLGLLRLAHAAWPQVALHASTQMSLFTAAGVNLVAGAGISRAILARELSLEELKKTKAKSKIELECFVHGALCICYSGQCLFSSMIGARSGNRGRCAQPCRLAYRLADKNGREIRHGFGEYLLSPRDLYGYLGLEDLYAVDLDSWKIEGRMKRPEYVAVVTSTYRQALTALQAGRPQSETERKAALQRLLQVFNRDYHTAYWYGNAGAQQMSFKRPNHRGLFLGRVLHAGQGKITLKLENSLAVGDGVEIWVKVGGREGLTVGRIGRDGQEVPQAVPGDTVVLDVQGKVRPGDRVFKTADSRLLAEARASWEQPAPMGLVIGLEAKLDQPLRLWAKDAAGFAVQYADPYIAQAAQSSPSTVADAQAQLARLGGSQYYLQELQAEIEPGLLLPKSVLNRCRRELVAALVQAHLAPYVHDHAKINAPAFYAQAKRNLPQIEHRKPRLTALVNDEENLVAAAKGGAAEIYWAAETYAPARPQQDWPVLFAKAAKLGAELVPALPRIFHEGETAHWQAQLALWKQVGAKACLAPTLNALGLLREAGWQGRIYGGSGMNILNSQAAAALAAWGVDRVCLSPELNLAQLQGLGPLPLEKELQVHGALALMISAYCPLGALCGGKTAENACARPCRQQGRFGLLDRKDYYFPCRVDQNCRLHLFNAKTLCLFEDMPALRRAGLDAFLLDLRLTEPTESRVLLRLYQRALAGESDVGLQAACNRLVGNGYTKGHLYRGI